MKHAVLAGLSLALVPVLPASETPAAPAPAAKPAAPSAAALPPADTAYELRGFFGSGPLLKVSLAAKGEKDSTWYAVGKKTGDILVEKADSTAGYAILSRNGVRSTVRLATAGSTAADADDGDEDAPDIKSREYRHKRFREMMEKSSPAQRAEFQRVAREKFEAMRKDHPEYFTDFSNPANREKLGELSLGIMHDAAEASAKLPDKDGKINPLPDDFDALMREEHKSNMDRFNRRGPRNGGGDAAPAAGDDGK